MGRKNVQAIYELSPMQVGMLFHTLQAEGADPGLLHVRCDLDGPFDPEAFEAAWQRMAQRHPVLRTALRWETVDTPVQIVLRDAPTPIHQHDLRGLRPVAQTEAIEAYIDTDRSEGLDLRAPPAGHLALFRLTDDATHLVWTTHHVLLDGWSGATALRETVSLYNASRASGVASLAHAPPFRDYVRWLGQQSAEDARDFWRKEFAGFDAPTPLPVQPASGANIGASVPARQNAELSHAASDRLRAHARQHHVTLSAVLHAAWAALLAQRADEDTVVFGSTTSGRDIDLPGVESMVGMLMGTVPLRVSVSPEASLMEVAASIHRAAPARSRHAHLPVAEIQETVGLPAHQRLFDTLLVVENFPGSAPEAGPLRMSGVRSGATSNYALTVLLEPAEAIQLHLVYDASRFSVDAMTRLLYDFQRTLERVADTPTVSVREAVPYLDVDRTRSAPSEVAEDAPRHRDTLPLADTYVAPSDAFERRLVDVWADVLNVQPIGMNDGFRELGGQSVQALQLLNRMEKAFKKTLPAALLFSGGTPARMAEALREASGASAPATSLVPLQPRGGGKPLYCVHSYDGQVLIYSRLAELLGPDRPVYGVQARGVDGDQDVEPDIVQMAERYVAEIRAAQPEGPYSILTICFGIAVSLEMARLFMEQGEEVGEFIVLDSAFWTLRPKYDGLDRSFASRIAEAVRDVRGASGVREIPSLLAPRVRELWAHAYGSRPVQRLRHLKGRAQQAFLGPRELRIWTILRTNWDAWMAYRASPYPGRVTLIRSSTVSGLSSKDWHLPIWRDIARGGLAVHASPGTHQTMLKEPYVHSLAARVAELLDASDARASGEAASGARGYTL